MKRNIIKAVAAVMVTILLLPVMPLKASAFEQLQLYVTDETYKLDGFSGSVYELDTVRYNCYGFTMGFEVVGIKKGNMKGNFNFEVCVHDTSGNWFVAEMFHLNEEYKKLQVDVRWRDARNIDKIAIIPRKKRLQTMERVYIIDPLNEPVYGVWGIEYSRSLEKFEKLGYWTYPLVLDETLGNCRGFTLHYEVDEITKGAIPATTNFEVYARAAGGKWKKIHTFKLYGDEAIEDIKIKNGMDIDEIAVLCRHRKALSLTESIALSDADYDMTYVEEEYPEYDDTDTPAPVFYLPGYWSDSLFKRSGRQSHPFVLNEPMKKCRAFTLDYQVTEVTEGKMKDDSRFVVYYQTYNGEWNRGEEFTLDEGFASVYIKLEKPATVNQVAVHCMNAGQFSYNFNMGIRNPEY